MAIIRLIILLEILRQFLGHTSFLNILKRQSHLKVVWKQKSNYSRGSIINMFRTSSFFKRKVNETSVMTFSSFKGPIQSQIGEKSNQ